MGWLRTRPQCSCLAAQSAAIADRMPAETSGYTVCHHGQQRGKFKWPLKNGCRIVLFVDEIRCVEPRNNHEREQASRFVQPSQQLGHAGFLSHRVDKDAAGVVRVLFRKKLTGKQSKWMLPRSIEPGEYQWEVRGPGVQLKRKFRILGQRELQELNDALRALKAERWNSNDPTPLLLHASLLESAGLLEEAKAVYQKVKDLFAEETAKIWLHKYETGE